MAIHYISLVMLPLPGIHESLRLFHNGDITASGINP